jgi:hypothetical protein
MTDHEVEAERVIALDQKQYYPVISVQVTYNDKDDNPQFIATYTRFRFSDKERKAIAAGADLLLSQPHHGLLMPIGLQLAMPGQYPLPEGK